MQIVLMFLIGLAGMSAHWLKLWSRGQTDLHIFHYINTNRKATYQALSALIASLFTLYQSDIIDYTSVHDFTTIFLAGYAADSVVNSDNENSTN
jgi:hypothetical protein